MDTLTAVIERRPGHSSGCRIFLKCFFHFSATLRGPPRSTDTDRNPAAHERFGRVIRRHAATISSGSGMDSRPGAQALGATAVVLLLLGTAATVAFSALGGGKHKCKLSFDPGTGRLLHQGVLFKSEHPHPPLPLGVRSDCHRAGRRCCCSDTPRRRWRIPAGVVWSIRVTDGLPGYPGEPSASITAPSLLLPC